MALGETEDRRGRPVRGSAGLLDRDGALTEIDRVLAGAQAGAGSALLIEGHAGMGKTRLHEAAIERARRLGLRVMRGAGAELERDLAFGVAGQVLRSLLASLPESERSELVSTAPGRLLALAGAGDGHAGGTGEELNLSHALFELIAAACAQSPALLALDDLHWSDVASLEFVLYLLHRLAELPLALVLSRRPGLREAAPDALELLAAHHRVAVHPLPPLGGGAVAEMARASLGNRIDSSLVGLFENVTGGNPFYLHELLLTLAESPTDSPDQLARRARQLAPEAVIRSLRVRVGRLGAAAAALARAVAVLGDDVPVRHAAALSGLSAAEAARAADALAQVEVLLAREPLRFVHPLVRQAIELDIPASERATRHLEAAHLLHDEGADAEHVAAHLLHGRPEGDPWAVSQLRAAAAIALDRGAPRSAVTYLQRALEEPPPREERPDVLAELGGAEAAAGRRSAAEHLEQALAAQPDPLRRAELSLVLGRALYAQGEYERAAAAYDAGLGELPPEPSGEALLALHDELQTGFIATASIVPALHGEAAARSAVLLPRARQGPRSHGQRLLLAQAASQASLAAEPAARIQELAEQAWDGGRLLAEEGPNGIGWSLVTAGLFMSGAFERCLEVTDAVLDAARAESQPLAFATASYVRGWPLLGQGQVTAAMADLERARDARRYGWRQFNRIAAGVYALCFVETGELSLAEAALTEDHELSQPYDLEDIARLYVLARMRLAEGRPADALKVALDAGHATQHAGLQALAYAPWREPAAEAALALGDVAQARRLAEGAHETAEAMGMLHSRVRALRLLGLTGEGEQAIDSLRKAAELGLSGPPRLETIRALIELGAALRRDNQRAAAREPLQQAADMAIAGGARALYDRARTELAAAGARPRRDVLLSGPESLTASERRIAELAASGQSNREIAQTLFVTPKTVEYHLRNVYRKLEIDGRGQLSGALAGG